MNYTIDNCEIIHLDRVHNRAGNITIIEGNKNIPFEIKRIYYLYDIPGGADRGGHAYKTLNQLLVAASGSFRVRLNDGKNKKDVTLNRPYFGLLITPGIWREIHDFSSGAVCLVAASDRFYELDYIRDYYQFLNMIIS